VGLPYESKDAPLNFLRNQKQILWKSSGIASEPFVFPKGSSIVDPDESQPDP